VSPGTWPGRDTSEQALLPDSDQRARVKADLGSTLFVEAGAGTGKTAALVDRVVAIVSEGKEELAAIAAITFTEKAASELRDRIRRGLEDLFLRERGTEVGERCSKALEQLDAAAIGTLHSFARRLLLEHPIEAGLPPRVEVMDEVASAVAFEERWSSVLDEILEDPSLERPLLLLSMCKVKPGALRHIAQIFEDNWDLVEEMQPQPARDPASVHDLFRRAADLVREAREEPCRDDSDKLKAELDGMGERLARLESASDEVELFGISHDLSRELLRAARKGDKRNYAAIERVRERARRAGEELTKMHDRVAEDCAARLGSALSGFTLAAARERRRSGELRYHDLLVLARALLRSPEHGPEVRRTLHRRYRRLLFDEFQDTDPIQLELAVRIAASEPVSEEAGSAGWDEVPVSAGQLFFVGDPKQSIYRFRRADIETFLEAQRRFGQQESGLVELTANFRSGRSLIEWVNHTFRELMRHDTSGDNSSLLQPPYVGLQATREDTTSGPAISVMGRTAHVAKPSAAQLRALEATDVTSVIGRIMDEGWEVVSPSEGPRRACLNDIAILVPARTSLPFLEDALETAGIPFRTEASALAYSSGAVRDVLMVLRAVDDPTNQLHLVSALRTPLLACGDDDLFRFKREGGGRWSYLVDQPDTVPADDPVRRGLDYLRELFEKRHWLAPSELLESIVRDRRVLEVAAFEGRPRDVWRRLRFVVDQSRAWSEATGGNLRQYMDWVARQAEEGARAEEPILPETDDDAVRILTIHSAKGLEFPIVVLSGMSTQPQRRRAPVDVAFRPDGNVGYRVGSQVVTEEYREWIPIDEQMDLTERIRLLYVACTRARDHLVVSLHRKARNDGADREKMTNAELLVEGMGALLEQLPDGAGSSSPVAVGPAAPADPPMPFAEWEALRSSALRRASLPSTVAATALTEEGIPGSVDAPEPGLEKRPRNLDLPPWLKGRYGTSVGRAVHGVLQVIDLSTGAGLRPAVEAQCEAEAVAEGRGTVERLVRAALASPSVREAAGRDHWREVYVCVPVEGRLLEGYIDLLYRSPEGLVVVDYKTASDGAPESLAERVDLYRYQGASYALAVAEATGEPAVRMTFVFLTPAGAVERHLPGLEEAVAEVRAVLSRGHEVVIP
jgi:ATP-dependent helicase/nuclease subunit A